MKKLALLVLILTSALTVKAATFCDDPLGANQVCKEMKNLRSHIMLLEEQRDLLQYNFKYVETVANSLSTTALDVKAKLPSQLENHGPALQAIAQQAKSISNLAAQKNTDAFVMANVVRNNCASCHTGDANGPGHGGFGDIFKQDWTSIVAKCNTPGRNPYMCKQMHGMISNYSYILTSYIAGIQNYEMMETVSSEMSRIAHDLINKNFTHNRTELMQLVANTTDEAAALAKDKNPESFEKGYSVVETCNKCHEISWKENKPLSFNIWKNK